MRRNYSWMSELGLVTVVSSLVMLMSPLGSVGTQGDWAITHNWESVDKGDWCHVIASDGVNHVEGTFKWGYGRYFTYSYDLSTWLDVDPQPSWSSDTYTFDFDTDWNDDYGLQFRIHPSNLSSTYDYYCWLDL